MVAAGLWGRSMGAVACLLHAQHDPEIEALVLDSPFGAHAGHLRHVRMPVICAHGMRNACGERRYAPALCLNSIAG